MLSYSMVSLITTTQISSNVSLPCTEKIKNSNPDLTVLKEYKQREAEFENRAKELEEVTKKRDEQKQIYDELRKKRLDEFMAGFNLISLKLKEMYQVSAYFIPGPFSVDSTAP